MRILFVRQIPERKSITLTCIQTQLFSSLILSVQYHIQ